MAESSLTRFDDDVTDIKKQSLYARLKRLFSTDVIVRNVGGKQLKIKDTDNIMYATDRNSLRDRFNRIRATSYNAYTRDFSLSYQAARMDLFRDYDCVGPDTIIPLPDGSRPTIAELTEKYKDRPQERFWVFSYDHKTDSIKLGEAFHPRKKEGGTREGYKITFDNGQYVIGSIKHPFMMRDGSYKMIYDLKVGDSVMPFYQKDFYGKGYRHLYNFSNGWQPEHKIIAEQIYRPLNENEVVHHKNFKRGYNVPDNLQIMTKKDHSSFHMFITSKILWSPENKQKTIEKVQSSEGYKNRKCHKWNGKRKGENNPFYGKQHSNESNELRSKTLKESYKDRDWTSDRNPNYRDDLTIELLKVKANEYYKENGKLTLWGLIKDIGCDYSTFQNRLISQNQTWDSFKEDVISTLNHTIVSIEHVGPLEVYDVTVDEYHNFATDSCFVANTMDQDPILSAALDIYADECVHGDTIIPLLNGEKIKIEDLYSQNRTNFWVYSLNEDGKFVPEKCERVACNGKKKMFRITLDDGTEIKCTSNHQWVKNDGSIVTTSELSTGTSLKVCKTKLSSNKFMNGYEMLFDGGKWKYTHRIVANNIPELVEQRDRLSPNGRLIHHVSFNKRNNAPEYLQWLHWKEHKLIHAKFNKELWSDPTIIHEYKEKTREGHRKYWTPEKRKDVADRQRKFMNGFVSSLTAIERINLYGSSGDKNGMFGQGGKLTKIKNGRWITSKNRPDNIDMNQYELDVVGGISKTEQMKKYNLLREDCKYLNHLICQRYGVKRQDQVKYKIKGYSSFKDYQTSHNHRVVSIEKDGEYDAYDLINVGKTTHLYAIETKDGSKLFTHNCLTLNEMKEMLVVHSKNQNIKKILHNLFYDILNIEGNMWSWTRNMVKYGDFFLRLYITPEYGIYMVEPVSAYNVERIENADPYNKRYVKFQLRPTDTSQAEVLENYEMAHFRLLSDSNFLPYGKAMIEGARRVWKQLSLMEDAMLIHRIMRAPERRIFKVDVGNIPPNEVDAFMEKMISKVKKVPYMDERTGEYNLRFNLQSMVEDFYLPVRGGDSGTEIDTLTGMEWTGTEDIEYIKNKMMAALKIPKAFLGYEEGISGKATLACVVPETKIPLLDGLTKTVKELIDDHNNGVKNYVYSIDEDTKNIVPGEIEWAGFTRMNAEVIRVHIDNGGYIDCTPDHRFMMRDGKWKEAKDLLAGESLMPLYRKNKVMRANLDYEMVYNPSTNKWEWTHKVIDNATNGLLEQLVYKTEKFDRNQLVVIHHKNFNRHDNSPGNLDRMSFIDHINLHKSNTEMSILSEESKRKAIETKRRPENRKKQSIIQMNRITKNPALAYTLKNAWASKTHRERSEICKSGWDDVRRKTTIDTNRKYNKSEKMKLAYCEKYKNGKFDSTGSLNGRWRERPSIQFIIDHINNHPDKLSINSFMGLSRSIKYHTSILREVICESNYTVTEFMNEHIGFVAGRPKAVKNHKIVKIEVLTEKRDTCDITIKKYHNFATSAGVIIHNSEDVRFARTIQRLQRILTSELSKIAVVHLYSQGYRDEALVDFELELTNPGTIFEQEKVEIWGDKISVASDMMEAKLFSREWIYKNIFNMSDDDANTVRDEVVEDAKQNFRFTSIEEEGHDPAKPVQKIGIGGEGGEGGGPEGGPETPGGGGGDLGDLEKLAGGPGGGGGGPETPGGGEGGPTGLEEKVEPRIDDRDRSGRDQSDRDQRGLKDAGDYPRAEDPRGILGRKEKPGSERETIYKPRPVREGANLPRVDKAILSNLKNFLSKPLLQEEKELREEIETSGSNKSLLDEGNIIEE